ncbi:hypothetical protein ECZU29_39760 [Escherichia coli]|nr:hypothetical protein ECZU29_39760 [Escherichia coli]
MICSPVLNTARTQVILLTPAADMARRVAEAERQLAELPRAETARRTERQPPDRD